MGTERCWQVSTQQKLGLIPYFRCKSTAKVIKNFEYITITTYFNNYSVGEQLTPTARPLSKSVQYFQKKQLDSRCVQHTVTHFQASLSECKMLYTIDKSIIFWKYCLLFLRMCIFCTTFAPDLYQRRNLTACDLFKRMLKTCSTRPQTVACGFFLSGGTNSHKTE